MDSIQLREEWKFITQILEPLVLYMLLVGISMMLKWSVTCLDIHTLSMLGEIAMEYMDMVHGIVLHITSDVLEQKAASIIATFMITILIKHTLQELLVQVQ